MLDDTTVTIEGTITMALGALESGRGAFIQDASGGIALYLDAPVTGFWPAGTTVTVRGSLSSRYSQRTLRVAESAVVAGPPAGLPSAVVLVTGAAGEVVEGTRVSLEGTIVGSPSDLADGIGITIDDGSGEVRAVIGVDALMGRSLASGMVVHITGPLGQRDSSGTGAAGYRVHATLFGELEVHTPTPSPTPTQTPTPTATPIPTATPTPSPAASLAAVRALPLGTRLTVVGVVTAEAGRLGVPALIVVGDADAGLMVRLPSEAGTFDRGSLLEVTGRLAAPHGQLELRPDAGGIRVIGTGPLPEAAAVPSLGLGEALEARIVTAIGRLAATPKTSGGDLTLLIERDGGATIKVMADVSSQFLAASIQVGATYRIVGVEGQRATRAGALDGYRVWLRWPADIVLVQPATLGGSAPTPAPGSPSPSGGGTTPAPIAIARGLRTTDRPVTIEGIVTTPSTLLDTTGRRVVIQDASGAIEVLVPTEATAPPVGSRIRATGRIGLAYGAPRLRADALDVTGSGAVPTALILHGQPGEREEWRLVTISGLVVSVHKLGARWRAVLLVGREQVAIVGQPGAGIASTILIEGRSTTITGIVRRPYPNATDRRFAVAPRFPADIRVASGSSASAGGSPGRSGMKGIGAGDVPGSNRLPPDAAGETRPVVDADLIELAGFAGAAVRVGGLVVDLRADGFTLDDGTAIGRVVVRGAALERLVLIEPDDALNATGLVEITPAGAQVVVDDPGGISLAGDPVADSPGPDASSAASDEPSPTAAAARVAGFGDGPWSGGAGVAGLGSLLAISAASVAVTLLRRQRSRRRLAARIGTRLAALTGTHLAVLTGTAGRPAEARIAERDPSTTHSA